MKRLILSYDPSTIDDFGEEYDTELNQMFSYPNNALTVCAAYLTQAANLDSGHIYSNEHNYYTEENEPVSVMIEDSEIVSRIFSSSFS